MTNLSEFSNEERALLVSVPYRVGIWISNCDDNEKSKFDDKRERQALEGTIVCLAGLHRKMPFAASIMKDIQSNKSLWSGWEAQASESATLADCQKAIDLIQDKQLSTKTPARALKEYKQTVWQIGIIVAQAFGEQIDPDNEMHADRFVAWLGSFVSAPKMAKSPENMSVKEKTALKKLRAILKG
jgi:hypothetical protein